MSRLSYRTRHAYVEATVEGGTMNLGACPIPVFALVRVPYEQAVALRAMLDEFIHSEEERRSAATKES